MRRALLISYHFPPDSSVGALRWQKMSRFFHDRGWALDVLTRDPNSLERRDDSSLKELPSSTRVHYVPEITPPISYWPLRVLRTLKQMGRSGATSAANQTTHGKSVTQPSVKSDEVSWIGGRRQLLRAYTSWLDYATFGKWARSAAAIGEKLLKANQHELIVSAGPPHMAHEAGRLLAHKFNLPYVMDMRDPWSLVQRLTDNAASPMWLKLAERHESRALHQASLIVTNSERAKQGLAQKYPSAAARMITIMNGVDDESVAPSTDSDRFTMVFAGTIYLDRNPRNLLRAIGEVVNKLSLTPDKFQVAFVGLASSFEGQTLEAIAVEEGLPSEFITVRPAIPRENLFDFLRSATMLVSLPQDSTMAIPAKIFDYLQFSAWLLALTNSDSATADLLRGTSADIVDPDDIGSIAEAIKERYRQFVSGERAIPINRDGRFSRRVQTDLLLDAIEKSIFNWQSPASV
jgi:glycosyltransferase involved in cell wall biosynthesis